MQIGKTVQTIGASYEVWAESLKRYIITTLTSDNIYTYLPFLETFANSCLPDSESCFNYCNLNTLNVFWVTENWEPVKDVSDFTNMKKAQN